MATNPMHQFKVYKIGPEIKIAGIDLSFTNASLFMLLSAATICAVLFLGTKEKKLIPGKFQLIAEKNLYKDKEPPSSIGTAFKLSTELVSAVVVGTIIGFILDTTFGTKPWLILIFFFVGVVAGIINVFRSAKNMQE